VKGRQRLEELKHSRKRKLEDAQPDHSKAPSATESNAFGNINNLIKALIWPLVILYILLRYHSPVSVTIELIPNLIKHATKVSAGGVTFEIEQKAQESGNENLAAALKGLSPQARKLLLQVGESYWHEWYKSTLGNYRADHLPELDELVNRKLVSFQPEDHDSFDKWVQSPGSVFVTNTSDGSEKVLNPTHPLSPDQEKRLLDEKFFLSPLGKKAYGVILDVVVHS
jgi:hypothetical protein